MDKCVQCGFPLETLYWCMCIYVIDTACGVCIMISNMSVNNVLHWRSWQDGSAITGVTGRLQRRR